MLRRPHDNLLEFQIGGPQVENSLNSVATEQYAISIVFSTDLQLPPQAVSVFFPLLITRHISIKQASVDISRKAIIVEGFADRLGVDYVLTALAAPGGIRGVAHFADQPLSLPLDAQAFRPEFVWAKLYTQRDVFGGLWFYIRNVNEYPFQVRDVTLPDGSRRTLNTVIDPFEGAWTRVGVFPTNSLGAVAVSKNRLRSVPNDAFTLHLLTDAGGPR